MMMKYRDLHNHTVHSDGDNMIREMIGRAVAAGLSQLGISDHLEAIKDIEKYIKEIVLYRDKCQEIDILVGIEIRVQTLPGLTTQQIQYLGSKLDYMLIEDIEYRASIDEVLATLQPIINSMDCKVGWAHLDLERLGEKRERVLEFTAANKMFIDFNIESTFYQNVLQGYEQINDVLFKGIEIIVGTDTHSMEDEWLDCITTAHEFIEDYVIGLFTQGKVSLARAAEIVQTPLEEFIELLRKKGIPWAEYGEQEFQMDLEFQESMKQENKLMDQDIKKQIEHIYQENLRLEQLLEQVEEGEKILKQLKLNDMKIDELTLKCSYIAKDVLVIDKIRSNTDKRKWLYAYFSKGKGYRYTDYYERIEELETVALYTKPVEA